MSDRPGGEFRGPLQPNSREWSWRRLDDDRPRVPLIGLFLVGLGALLLLRQFVPALSVTFSAVVVVVGVVLILLYLAKRAGILYLYAGTILVALSLPGLLQDLNVIREGGGWGTLFLGIGFIAIALIRTRNRAGTGWQMVVGIVLTVLGGLQVLARELPGSPTVDNLLWPLVILVAGIWLISRSRRPPDRTEGRWR
jgi:hypothetical protein